MKKHIRQLWEQFQTAQEKGDHGEAVQWLEELVAAAPDVAPYWAVLGSELEKVERWSDAEVAFKQSIKLKPDSATAHSGMAHLYFVQGRLDAAEECLQRALECDASLPTAYSLLGVIESRRGKYKVSEQYHRKAIALDPDVEESFLNLGLALVAQGRFSEAEAPIRRALELDPGYEDARNALERLKQDLKDRA